VSRFRSLESRFNPLVQEIAVLGSINQGVRPNVSAIVVDKSILHDRENPRLEVSVPLKLVLIGQGFVNGFLQQVFGIFRIRGQTFSEKTEPGLHSD